jgi:hypothetical protein
MQLVNTEKDHLQALSLWLKSDAEKKKLYLLYTTDHLFVKETLSKKYRFYEETYGEDKNRTFSYGFPEIQSRSC